MHNMKFNNKSLALIFALGFLAPLFISVLITGYEVFSVNQNVFLPPLFHRIDPSLFQHDEFDYELLFGGHSFFLDLLEQLIRTGINIFWLLFLLTLLTRIIFFISIYFITDYFVNNKLFSLFILFFFVRGFGGGFLTYEMLAIASGLCFLAILLRGSCTIALLLLFFSFMMHPITGAALFILYGFFLLRDILSLLKKPHRHQALVLATRLFLILGFFLFFFSFKGGGESILARYSSTSLAIALRSYQDNVFLLTWFPGALLSLIAWFCWGFLLALYSKYFFGDRIKREPVFLILFSSLSLIVITVVGGDLLLLQNIALLQLPRGLFLLKMVVVILTGYLTIWSLRRYPDHWPENFFLVGMSVWALFRKSFTFFPEPMFLYVPSLALLLFSHHFAFTGKRKYAVRIAALTIFALILLAAGIYSIKLHVVPAFTFFVGTTVFSLLIAIMNKFRSATLENTLSLFPKIFFVSTVTALVLVYIILAPRYFPFGKFSIYPLIWQDRPFMDLCSWIDKRTDRSDVFVIEPFVKQGTRLFFRLGCFREPFFIEEEASGQYNPDMLYEWQKRSILQKNLKDNPSYIDKIQQEYRVDYMISSIPLTFAKKHELVFSNGEYFVYKLGASP